MKNGRLAGKLSVIILTFALVGGVLAPFANVHAEGEVPSTETMTPEAENTVTEPTVPVTESTAAESAAPEAESTVTKPTAPVTESTATESAAPEAEDTVTEPKAPADNTTSAEAPKTGDRSHLPLYGGLAVVAILVVGGVIIVKIKRK